MLLTGKTAVITGCRRGIGKAIVEAFARNGADVFACVRSESVEFNEWAARLASQVNVTITPVAFDLSDESQVMAGVRTILGFRKPVDVLVNNAGVAAGGLFQMTPMQQIRETFAVNYFGLVQLTQGISRYMARQKKGSIINVASTAGLIGDAGTIGYGASKAALILATKTMATELGPVNIRVNAVAPSVTRTDMFDQMDPKARDSLIEATALKRPAEAAEIANVVLFLASDLSTYVSGQTVRVDGGLI